MLAAAREKKIASLVLMAATAAAAPTSMLEQQRHQLDLMKTSDAERQAKIDLQKQIQTAVLTDKGWEGIPEDVRKQADTPWFRSLLDVRPGEDHASTVKQPILIVQGDLDTQVPPHHAEQLAELARQRKKAPSGGSRCTCPASTICSSRPRPARSTNIRRWPDTQITPDVATTIAEWLRR